jgi:small-conductance mechanosensitive channel
MSSRCLSFLVLAVLIVACPAAVAQTLSPMVPQTAPAAPPTSTPHPLTAEEAQRALDTLQDDAKRAQVIATLRAIATASPAPVPQAKPAPIASNGLGAELLAQVSQQLGDMSQAFVASARTLTDFPLLWAWLKRTATDPFARDLLIDIAWKLPLILGCALAVEWLVSRVLRRPLAILQARVPSPSVSHPRGSDRAIEAGSAPDPSSVDAPMEPTMRRKRAYLKGTWRFLIRFPFVFARLLLDVLPVIGFAAVGNLLLGTQLGSEATPRLVILAIVNAYVLCRSVMCVVRALISSNPLSLVVIQSRSAAYFETWARRIVTLAIFGVAFANVALLLGLFHPGYEALVRLVALCVHLFLVVIVLQCRESVTRFLRSPDGGHGLFAMVRNRLADVWHYVAVTLILALWIVWAFDLKNGYMLMLQYFVGTAMVLTIARLVSIATLGAIDRAYRVNTDIFQRFPGIEARANRYLPLLHAVASSIIAALAVIALLEVWGVDALVWFNGGQIGGRVVSAVGTIGIAAVAALAVWEASNALIENHLSHLIRDMNYVRAARLRTFLPMLRTALLCVVLTVVGLTVLSEIGVNVAPLLAGAGIVGIAIGFGSQKLVQDVITGLFLLLENVVQVGDFVTVAGLSGTVENLSIRTIRLRAGDGSVHVIPFSAVTSITNTNRGIGNAAISVNVSYEEDTDRVSQVLREIAAGMRQDPGFQRLIRSDLDLWGVDKVDGVMASIVGQIECTDGGRWPVQREFNRRMKRRFQELGIEIARPNQTIVMQVPASVEPDAEPAPRRSIS